MSFRSSPYKIPLALATVIIALSVCIALSQHGIIDDQQPQEQSSTLDNSPAEEKPEGQENFSDSGNPLNGPAIGSSAPLQDSERECLAEEARSKDPKVHEKLKQNLMKAPGYAEAQSVFSVDVDQIVESVLTSQSGEGRSIWLQTKSPHATADTVHWTVKFADLNATKSKLSWRDLVSKYKAHDELIGKVVWLEKWKSKTNGTVELDESYYVSQEIVEAWRKAKFAGTPEFVCHLDDKERGDKFYQQLALSKNETRTMLIKDSKIATKAYTYPRTYEVVSQTGDRTKI